MATVLSAKQSTTGSPYAFYTLVVTASNRTATTVRVNYEITSWLQYAESSNGITLNAYITAGGTKSSAIKLKGTEYWTGTTKHTKTGYFTVKDLSATTDSISIYFEVDSVEQERSALKKTKCKSLTIPIYAKATVPSLNKSEATLGSTAVTISMPRDVSVWTHKLTYSIGSLSGTIGTDLGTSKSWTPPLDLAKAITGTEGTVTITCQTFDSAGNSKGKNAVSLKVIVPQNTNTLPSIDSVSLTEAASEVTSKFALPSMTFLQNVSKIKAAISASGKYGASISNYAVDVAGTTYKSNSFTTSALTKAGESLSVNVSVKDSRGFPASTSKSIKVIPYAKPTLSSIQAKIVASGDTYNAEVSIAGRVSSVEEKNTKTLTLKWVNASEGTSGSQNVTISDWDFNVVATVPDIDPTAYCTFTAELTDKLYSATPISITTGTVVISRLAGGKGVTFGGEAEEEGFVSKWNARFYKDVVVNGTVTIGGHQALHDGMAVDYIVEQGEKTADGVIWFYEKYASGKVVANCYNTSTVNCTTASGNLYQGNTNLTLPSDLFVSCENIQISAAGSSGAGYSFFGRYVYYTTYINVLFFATASATKDISYSAMIIGKWK